MRHANSNRARGRDASRLPAPPLPAFAVLEDVLEAGKYGAFRDDVELEDVLEAGESPDPEAGRTGRGV